MRYRSRTVEVEAMRWEVNTSPSGEQASQLSAMRIVEWVNANGGAAEYQPDHPWSEWGTPCVCNGGDVGRASSVHPERIRVRTINGWSAALPGHYVVKGEATFEPPRKYQSRPVPLVRDFYPCDPETFDRRWVLLEVARHV